MEAGIDGKVALGYIYSCVMVSSMVIGAALGFAIDLTRYKVFIPTHHVTGQVDRKALGLGLRLGLGFG